jgi:xylulokinase
LRARQNEKTTGIFPPFMNGHSPSKLFLGLDSSTQSLSAVVIDLVSRKVIYEKSLNFDHALPHYKTQNGVLPNRDPLVKHSPPLMWAEALDLIFAEMKNDGVPLGKILAVSGCGQQHGSVYFNEKIGPVLANLDPKKSLVENLHGVFTRKTSPIWMDSSTAKECAEIRKKLGGIKYTASRTGSDTFERFTGPQIRKFFKTEPDACKNTSSIALVSSFMASLLAGKIAPMDFGDGAGMNLMDIRKKIWDADALKATAPSLKLKLPPLAASGQVIGKISNYFVEKFGLNPEALATTWTGDNPASVIGLGLIKPGQVAVSLGTSDTFFGTMEKCQTDENGEGHVFGSPTGGYMTLICFKNGSLAREKIRELYGIKNWDEFGKLVAQTKPGNDGGILLPWFEAEIVPRVNQPGIHRFDLDEKNAAANCRAIFEAQMLSMRLHSQWMKVVPEKILATGGASNDLALLQVMADVMNCRVQRIEISKSAALGAAIQAAHGFLTAAGKNPKWEKLVTGFTAPIPNSEIRPDKKAAKIYDKLIKKYAACEGEALDTLS